MMSIVLWTIAVMALIIVALLVGLMWIAKWYSAADSSSSAYSQHRKKGSGD